VEHALNIVLTTIGLAQILLIGWIVVSFRKKVAEITQMVRAFCTPTAAGESSPLADVVSVGSDMVARSIVAQAKGTFMGLKSGEVRAERAVEGAIAEDVARSAHPLAGTLLDAMPELRKTLRKNPQLLDFALSKLGDIMVKKEGAGTRTITPIPNNGARKGGING